MDTPTDVAVLSAHDEKDLARAIEAGVLAAAARRQEARPGARAELAALEQAGIRAWHRFALSNVRLVWLVVLPVARRTGVDSDELFQEGYLGLLESMQRFDHTRDARFATFALPWIRMRVSNASATNLGALGLPARRARTWRRVRGVEDRLVVSLGRPPTDDEIAVESGDEVVTVARLRPFVPPQALPFGVDVPMAEPDPARVRLDQVGSLVTTLPPEQREVMVRRFGLGAYPAMNPGEVAEALGVSESTVRRRERAALALLRCRVGQLAA